MLRPDPYRAEKVRELLDQGWPPSKIAMHGYSPALIDRVMGVEKPEPDMRRAVAVSLMSAARREAFRRGQQRGGETSRAAAERRRGEVA